MTMKKDDSVLEGYRRVLVDKNGVSHTIRSLDDILYLVNEEMGVEFSDLLKHIFDYEMETDDLVFEKLRDIFDYEELEELKEDITFFNDCIDKGNIYIHAKHLSKHKYQKSLETLKEVYDKMCGWFS